MWIQRCYLGRIAHETFWMNMIFPGREEALRNNEKRAGAFATGLLLS